MKKEGGCALCPRECGAVRKDASGFCGARDKIVVARAMLHLWEEPGICTGAGSGAIFFSGCQLRCVFCQNHSISHTLSGRDLTREDVIRLIFSLAEKGACNINLVSPTPYLEDLLPILETVKKRGLSIPILYNSGGYEKASSLSRLSGLVDIYLPDFKFFSPEISRRYAAAEDYEKRCSEAVLEMYRQVGDPVWKNGALKKGVIIRHLVLPGCVDDSERVLRHVAGILPRDGVVLSLLRQYTPLHLAALYPKIARNLTTLEYQRVVRLAREIGFPYLYTQKKESVGTKYVPDFSVFRGF